MKGARKRRQTLLQRANAEVRRLSEFEHFVRLHGRHTEWCPAHKTDGFQECTCGFSTIFKMIK